MNKKKDPRVNDEVHYKNDDGKRACNDGGELVEKLIETGASVLAEEGLACACDNTDSLFVRRLEKNGDNKENSEHQKNDAQSDFKSCHDANLLTELYLRLGIDPKNGGGKGIRTLVGFPPNGFQDRLVMTTSISLHKRSTDTQKCRLYNTIYFAFCQD